MDVDELEHNNKITVMVVDDDEGFCTLMQRKLQGEGFQTLSAGSGNEAIERLGDQRVDLMLLDFMLPDMTGNRVVEILRQMQRSVPFILVTGQGDERLAVEMMKGGACDYLIKDQSLLKLLPSVVNHTIKQLRQQQKLREAERALRESEAQYHGIFNSATDAFFVMNFDGQIIDVNPQATIMYGYTPDELKGMAFKTLIHSDFYHLMDQLKYDSLTQKEIITESVNVKKDGDLFDVEVKGTVFEYKGQKHILIIVRDISERKWAEEELKLTNQQLRISEQALRERETRLRAIFQGSAIGIALVDLGGRAIESNHTLQAMLGYTALELREKVFTQFTHGEDREDSLKIFEDLTQGKCEHYRLENRLIHKEGFPVWVRMTASLVRGESGRPNYIINITEDISEQKNAEELLRHSEAQYRLLFENMLEGFAYHEVLWNEAHKPVDYKFLEVNDAFEKMTGLRKKDIIGRKVSEIVADIRGSTLEWVDTYSKVVISGQDVKFEQYSESLDRWFSILAYSPQQGYIATIFEDITHRRQIEEELRMFTAELERSNRELEQFTRVITDDLKKPLGRITEIVHELNHHMDGRADEQCQGYFGGISQAAERAQRLLDDLSRYSRLDSQGQPFEQLDMTPLVLEVLSQREEYLKSIEARIEVDELPRIWGDKSQIRELFENLIDNSIKFRGSRPLELKIASHVKDEFWEISVSDNGIGIEPCYHERIFGMFERIHPPEQYPGAGIGLPISKKIIDRHGGKIEIDSQMGRGCVIKFTIPQSRIE
ncbi:MAG: PAS domain S-box protein [Sedimentisphaerales bacterium]|nr:PAS domain S-box protein [Sedimentisphaerales bacterium]